MKADSITEDELFSAIEEYLISNADEGTGKEPGTITSTEAMKKYKLSRRIARATLLAMMEDGKLEPAYVHRRDVWGSNQRIRGFRWVNGEE